MIKSMTGYGKAEAVISSGTLSIEIRTLNGKSADINIRTSLFPKDKELEVRSRIAQKLVRGTIDVYMNKNADASDSARKIDTTTVLSYVEQANEIAKSLNLPQNSNTILEAALRMPDIFDSRKNDVICEDDWEEVSRAIDTCLEEVDLYRCKEGEALYRDITGRVNNILSLYDEVESLEGERIESIKARILKTAEDLKIKLDEERFEQEMIYYIEKLDINEEKIRLRQHCKYFLDTISNEAFPGKKLGFIIQEMGREINTTGSKAGHAEIQKLVVKMKDELEKMREQTMNVL